MSRTNIKHLDVASTNQYSILLNKNMALVSYSRYAHRSRSPDFDWVV